MVQDLTTTEDVDDTYTGFESIREHSRRVRMSQSAGDDVVANSRSHRKRKKGKGKKLSSATSMCIAHFFFGQAHKITEINLPLNTIHLPTFINYFCYY